MTAEQINQIAALPKDADFRFAKSKGETVVVVIYPEKMPRLLIYEDGTRFLENGINSMMFSPASDRIAAMSRT